jgi:hypothetical protein
MKMTNEVVGFALGLFIASSSTAFAQGYVQGVVLWRVGQSAVGNAVVIVRDNLNMEVGRDTTDVLGQFYFALPADSYHLSFGKTGFRDTTLDDIIVTEDETTRVNMLVTWINICHYVVGDVNGSGTMTGIDVIIMVRYFKGSSLPIYSCECTPGHTWHVSGDVNGSCTFTGQDVTGIVRHFKCGWPYRSCPDCPPEP